jgi:2-iminobutanoate/2-iminopropanoate deaminase
MQAAGDRRYARIPETAVLRGAKDQAMIDSVSPPEIWSPFGTFSMAVIQGSGQVVYLKGQVALDHNGQVVGVGDMAAQTRQALENIKSVLAHLGGAWAMSYR